MSTNKEIARSASVIGLFTLCSRALGFIRDVVIARLFGTYAYAQAFVVAFRIPNLFRESIAEGAVNAAYVPVFTEYSTHKSKEEFWLFANCMLNIILVVLSVITVLGVTFAPLIVRVIAPGFSAEALKLQETIRLTRLIYPYIFLIGLYAYAMGILNSLRHFSLPAFAPCLLNISIIVFALVFGENTLGLALGVLIGGLAQLLIQIPALYKKGFRYRLILKPGHPGVRQVGRLLLPRCFSSCIYQLNVFVDTILASFPGIVGAGGVAALYFANRIFQFPLSIFAVALAQAALPALSRQGLEENKDSFKKTLKFSLVTVFFIMLPVTSVIVSLGPQIVEVLFQRGRFDSYSASITSGALMYYSLGLVGYSANKLLLSCFFSLKDTLKPLKITVFSLLLNIFLNLILMYPLKLNGLALASAASGVVSSSVLFYCLRKKIGPFGGKYLMGIFARISFASVLMGVACFYSYRAAFFEQAYLRLLISFTAGALVFVLSSLLIARQEANAILLWIFKRK